MPAVLHRHFWCLSASVSFWLISRGIRWRPFGIRLAQIVAAALAITIATYQFTPDSFVFFGILHQIAAASLLGLLFLRLPAFIIAFAAAGVVAASHFVASSAFDAPWLWPLGLCEIAIRSNDFVPIFPWFGAVLVGMALTPKHSSISIC